MRAVWWRELRELFVPALAVWVALGIIGMEFPARGLRHEAMTIIACIGGGLGVFQGLLDRRRRDDGFLLHRPIGALGIHGARSLAGASLLGVGALVAAIAGLVEAWRVASLAERMRETYARAGKSWGFRPSDWGVVEAPYGSVVLDASGALLGVALLFGGWAIVRYAVARRRIHNGILVAGALAVGGWSLVARCPTVPLAAVVAIALVAVIVSLSVPDLAGDRR